MEILTLKILKKVQGKEEYQAKISSRFTALENSKDDADIKRACGTVRENINNTPEKGQVITD
jgi:hypothetical protein